MCILRYEFVHNAIKHEQINEHNELLVITYNNFLGRNKKKSTVLMKEKTLHAR